MSTSLAKVARKSGSWPDGWVGPLVKGAVFAGLARNPGSFDYRDETNRFSSRGTLTNMEVGDWYYDSEIDRWALNLGGTDEYVAINNGLLVPASADYTVCCWAKSDDTSQNAYFLSAGTTGNSDKVYHLGYHDSTQVAHEYWGDAHRVSHTADTEWHHWAFTYRHATTTRDILLDGPNSLGVKATGTYTETPTATAIGRRESSPGGTYFNGRIADMLVFQRVLSPGEIYRISRKTWQPIRPTLTRPIRPSTAFEDAIPDIIAGLTSSTTPTNGWNNLVRDTSAMTVVRTSDTVVTITLDAVAAYDISSQETVEATVPQSALVGDDETVATPTFTIDAVGGGGGIVVLRRRREAA